MNNVVFGKTKENLSRKQNKKELFGCHKKTIIQNNFFSENLLPIEVKKNTINHEQSSVLRFIYIRNK